MELARKILAVAVLFLGLLFTFAGIAFTFEELFKGETLRSAVIHLCMAVIGLVLIVLGTLL